MAVGMACAGTGLRDAISLLEPMLSDNTDFVRQGALIAMALVMMQQPEHRLATLRKRLDKIIKDKHEEVGRWREGMGGGDYEEMWGLGLTRHTGPAWPSLLETH